MKAIEILEIEEKNKEIISNDFFSVKYLYFEAGKGMLAHTEQAIATIQVVEGRITFVMEDKYETCMMPQNTIFEFDARRPHSLIAHEDSKLLVTIVPIK